MRAFAQRCRSHRQLHKTQDMKTEAVLILAYDDAFSLDGAASDSDSGDIQQIKPDAVKPTLDLKNVPIWGDTISTRNNAQAIKISLGSAGYFDTTKGKGTRQMILLAAPRHATSNFLMALAIVNSRTSHFPAGP
eukprot:jgi/Tetstr1/427217/TSEL_017405.t1